MARVVITGIGAVTPLGNNFPDSWSSVKAGLSGIHQLTRVPVSGLKWTAAGELRNFDASGYLGAKEIRRLDPFVHYAVASAVMSAEDAGLTAGRHNGPQYSEYLTSGGVIFGSGRGGISTLEQAMINMQASSRSAKRHRFSSYLMPATTIIMAASSIARRLGIKGHCLAVSNACASGTNAVGEAYRLLRTGFKGPLIAGGSDAPLCRLCIEGYGVSGALSKIGTSVASRPFDRQRDGFVLAEGACSVVLESLDAALDRGAKIYAEISGYGNTADAFHQTKPDAEGEIRALRSAIAESGMKTGDIDYINSHGTSTQLGDRVESEAILTVFGERGPHVPVSAIKSMTGHMLAASGAFETACTAMSLREGVVPPTINLEEKDSSCGIRVVTEKTRLPLKAAISSSFGFGGVNAVLVLRKSE